MLRAHTARKSLQSLGPVRRAAAEIAAIHSSRSDNSDNNLRVAGLRRHRTNDRFRLPFGTRDFSTHLRLWRLLKTKSNKKRM